MMQALAPFFTPVHPCACFQSFLLPASTTFYLDAGLVKQRLDVRGTFDAGGSPRFDVVRQ